jgi:very-short-patch-repair endonuclease
MAAVLSCGPEAVLSHQTAAGLWEILRTRDGPIHLSVPRAGGRGLDGIVAHRRSLSEGEVAEQHGIPVTSPICTLIDLAALLDREPLEAAINEADKLNLVDPARLREALDRVTRRPGIGVLREILDRRTFTLTDSELERRFLPIARAAGLSKPETGRRVNGFKVDFYWPDLGFVVETDGLRYHRTPQQQARDRVRDQALTAAGLTLLRFTRAQVRYEPGYVEMMLRKVVHRLRSGLARGGR